MGWSWMATASWNGKVVAESDDIVHLEGNAAWYYSDPSSAAREIKHRIAFCHGIQVEESNEALRSAR